MTVKTTGWVDDFLAKFDQMDEALVSANFPATSPWWRREIERFLRSGRRRWVIRAGRRSGKSTTLSRLTLCWALFGAWSVPLGDTAIIPVVSTDHRESGSKLRTVADVLSAMGISYERRSDEIEIPSRRVVFRSITCSVRGVVGFTAVAIFGDEMSRWESRDDAANPAAEVLGSMRPSMATQPLAFEICSSSPWSLDDYHATLCDAGTDEHQFVSFAETWTANPTISEARTHELEPDERTWAREYAAVPGVTLSAALDPADLAACFNQRPLVLGCPGFLAIDASALRGDAFAFCAGFALQDGALAVTEAGGFTNDAMRTMTVPDVVAKICERAHVYGVKTVFADNYEKGSLPGHFEAHGIQLQVFDWSQKSKHEAMTRLRRMMRERTLSLPNHDGLRKQLGNLKQRLVPSGGTKYFTNGLDYASALLTAMHGEVSGDLVHVEPVHPRGSVWTNGGVDFASCGFDNAISYGGGGMHAEQYAPIRGGGLMDQIDRNFRNNGLVRVT